MQLCYVDESGKAETPTTDDPSCQPVMVIAGVAVPEEQIYSLTSDWIDLKREFWPSVAQKGRGRLDAILHDVKGVRLRDGLRADASRRRRQHAVGFLDSFVSLLEQYEARVVGRITVKALGSANDDMGIHSSALQFICGAFHSVLPPDERGMVVVDSQTYWHNHQLAHSIFTQRFGRSHRFAQLVDLPVFGHSDNHAGLQLADVLCSALLAPIACSVYASDLSDWNVHCAPDFLELRERYGQRLHGLTFRWFNPRSEITTRSLVVADAINNAPTRLMWAAD